MTYLTHPDFNRAAHAAFLAKCAASPADDTPRLVYADWLQEWGGEHSEMVCERCKGVGVGPGVGIADAVPCSACHGAGRVPTGAVERAEFVRVQCELARRGFGEVKPELLKREDDIGDLARLQRSLWMLPQAGDWFGDQCYICLGRSVYDRCVPDVKPAGLIRRGFVAAVRGPLAALLDHLPRMGVELGLVERAEASDCYPRAYADHADQTYWYWPTEICMALDFHDAVSGQFPTEAAARDALSAAILAVCRGRAGLEVSHAS